MRTKRELQERLAELRGEVRAAETLRRVCSSPPPVLPHVFSWAIVVESAGLSEAFAGDARAANDNARTEVIPVRFRACADCAASRYHTWCTAP